MPEPIAAPQDPPTDGALTIAPATDPSAAFATPALPERIGAYRVHGVLGVGGMGVVYDAEQEHPHRRVALKVVRDPDGVPASRDARLRFGREAEALGRLQHPGIAQIYAAGVADGPHGPQPYFAMERVDGRPLTAWAADAPLRDRLALFAAVCDAVHYAHQRGVIHRDLKPANVLVDAAGQSKVLDFGVARLTDADVQATRATSAGEVIGTLQYMSPEQLAGDPQAVDTRADVYALGVILYELLAGRRPYELTGRQLLDVARVIATAEPPLLGTLDRRLRGDLETIAAKALEKDPARRYASAAGLAGDVRRYLNDEPITARPASAAYQLRKLARRNKPAVAAACFAVGFVFAIMFVLASNASRRREGERFANARRAEAEAARALAVRRGDEAAQARVLAEERRADAEAGRAAADSARGEALLASARAVASAEQAGREAAKATAVNAFLQDMLGSANPYVARGRTLTVRDVVDAAARRVAQGSLHTQPEVEAAVRTTLGDAYFEVGALDSAVAQHEAAYAVRRRTLGAVHPDVGWSALRAASAYGEKGDHAAAAPRLEEALRIYRGAVPPDDPRLVRVLLRLSHLRYVQGRLATADSLAEDALARARRHARGRPDTTTAAALTRVAELYTFVDKAAAGEPLWRETLAMVRALHGENHPDVATTHLNFSYNLYIQRKLPEAEAEARAALAGLRTLYGDEPRMTANAVDRLGSVLYAQQKYAEAEPLMTQSLALRRASLGDAHTDVAYSRAQLGRMYVAQKRYAEADTLFAQALAGRTAALGARHPAVASSMEDVALVANARGDTARAEGLYRQSSAIWREAGLGEAELRAVGRRARALAALGRPAQADSLLRDALTRRANAPANAVTAARQLLAEIGAKLGAAAGEIAPR